MHEALSEAGLAVLIGALEGLLHSAPVVVLRVLVPALLTPEAGHPARPFTLHQSALPHHSLLTVGITAGSATVQKPPSAQKMLGQCKEPHSECRSERIDCCCTRMRNSLPCRRCRFEGRVLNSKVHLPELRDDAAGAGDHAADRDEAGDLLGVEVPDHFGVPQVEGRALQPDISSLPSSRLL